MVLELDFVITIPLLIFIAAAARCYLDSGGRGDATSTCCSSIQGSSSSEPRALKVRIKSKISAG